uniref:1-acylglycerol-3-phosphate O-acyltransferase n=1 Tax=Cynara cardunculus var. scolymus TaxID=59895 RepID=A0A103YLQ4_CYNCS
MAIAAAVVIVPIGVLFFVSGLIVNLIQALIFVIVRPFSKSIFRRINRMVAELLWLELVWIVDWWAGVKVNLYTDPETLRMMGMLYTAFIIVTLLRVKNLLLLTCCTIFSPNPVLFPGKEHALVIANHKSDIDWLIGWVFAQRSGCLGSTLAVMKKSSKFLPVIGWSMWFSEYLFLERSWAKDESTLKSGLQSLKDYPQPFWLALFVEGTRFTKAKLLAAQEYASSMGLPVPRNVLIPRTKGFVTSVSQMRSFVPAIIDMTVAIPKDSTPPTMLRLFKGQSSVVSLLDLKFWLCKDEIHVKVTRHSMKDLPESDEAVAQWCKDKFIVKDDVLDQHKIADAFPDSELVVVSWACLLVFGTFKFLQWSNLLSSWKGLTFAAVGLATVTILMQILIQFSQAEHSTPAKVAPVLSSNGTVREKSQ